MRFPATALALTLSFVVAAGPLRAADPGAPASDGAILADDLPEAVVKRIRRNPAGYIADIAGVISTYGTKGAIDAPAIDRMIALGRAKARAGETERFLRADLDGDGTVAQAEFAALTALSQGARKAALERAWAKADADASGGVDPAELAAHAAAVAADRVTEADADGWRAILHFDGNRDGRTDVGEVIAGVAARQDAQPDAGGQGS